MEKEDVITMEELTECLTPNWDGMLRRLNELIKNKNKMKYEPQKEWEIISFKHKGFGYIKLYNGPYHRTNSEYYNSSLNHVPKNAEILSVKRLSDGEVFTIGDNTSKGCVTGFFIGRAGMKVHFGSEGCSLEGLKKIKKPLFTTDDVPFKQIFETDIFFIVELPSYRVSKSFAIPESKKQPNQLYFSTIEKAEEFVLFNKPCLSLNDLLDAWNGDSKTKEGREYYGTSNLFNNFKEAAKQKINK